MNSKLVALIRRGCVLCFPSKGQIAARANSAYDTEEQQDGLEEKPDLINVSLGSPKPQASLATSACSNYSTDYEEW